MRQEAEADEGTGEVQEGEDGGCVAVAAHGQLAELHHLCLCPLHNPTKPPQPLARLDAAASKVQHDPTTSQRLAYAITPATHSGSSPSEASSMPAVETTALSDLAGQTPGTLLRIT